MDSALGAIESSDSSTEGTVETFQPDRISTEGTAETFRFDPTDEELVVDIAEAVASAADKDVLEFTPRINDVIDADALTRCLCSADETLRITFSLGEHRITAVGCGLLRVEQSG